VKEGVRVTEQIQEVEVGDWLLHSYYGLGQVQAEEVRPIHGDKTETYRVETRDAEYWVPVDNVDNPRIRQTASKRAFRKAVRLLKKEPETMQKNYRSRHARIREVLNSGSLEGMTRLIRDLRARRKRRGKLNQTEKNAQKMLRRRISREWAVVMGTDLESAQQKLNKAVRVALDKVKVKKKK